jgi:hypothetical protein
VRVSGNLKTWKAGDLVAHLEACAGGSFARFRLAVLNVQNAAPVLHRLLSGEHLNATDVRKW